MLRFATALFCVSCLSRSAAAAMMEHTDLTSLALEADAAVRGHVVASRKVNEYTTTSTIEVSRSFKGPLAVGAKLDLAYDLYETTRLFADEHDAPLHVLGPELIFFVAQSKPAPDGSEPHWGILSSGLRIVLDGKAYRFEQWNNPGGFEPVPQRHDPFDLFDDPRAGEQLDLPGLETEIERALGKAQIIASTLAEPASLARTERLVQLVGAEPAEAPANSTVSGFYTDVAGHRIVTELARGKELRPVLRALVRSPGALGLNLPVPFTPDAVFDAVADQGLPLPERRAAIRLLGDLWYSLRRDPTAEARTLALYTDPAPEIRRDVLRVQPRDAASAAQKAAIVARWHDETDDGVRLALLQVARQSNVQLQLEADRARLPIVVATRTRDVVHVAWGDLDSNANWMVARASRLILNGPHGERSVDPFAGSASYANGNTGSFEFRIPPARELATERVTFRVTLEDGGVGPHPPVVRSFELGSFTQVTPYVAPVDLRAPADRPEPEPARSRCHCDAPGAGSTGGGWLFGLLALLRRRRTATV